MHRTSLWIATALTLALAGALFAMTGPPNLDAVLQTQEELAAQYPGNAKVINDLGNLLLLANRTEEAEEAYRRATELAPEDPVPHYNLALLLQEQGKTKAALKQLLAVSKADPTNAWAQFQIGAIYESFGERRKAIGAYSAAFALDPHLASPEENPQVIESKWVYEAMVRGYRDQGARPLAPKVYEDPSRIARLLVFSSEIQSLVDGTEAGETGEAGGAEAALADGVEGTPVVQEGAPVEDGEEVRGSRQVLTPDTIERGGTVGQVSRPGSARSARPRSNSRRPPSVQSARPSTRPQRGFREPGTSTESRSRPGRVRYRPSARSTGSLGLELRPPAATLPRAS